jgi:glycosyltransferase involved in cell wall biosynthesis
MGGLGRHVAELAPALARQGVEIHVITPVSQSALALSKPEINTLPADMFPRSQKATVTLENGVVVHRVMAPVDEHSSNIYTQALEVNRLLVEYVMTQTDQARPRWDLIHTHDWLTSLAAIALKDALGCPLVATIHATERGRGRGYLSGELQWSIDRAERHLIDSTDRVIVCSKHMVQELQSFFQVPVAKLTTVPNGVDVTKLNHLAGNNLAQFRANYAKPNDKIVFTVSRLVYEKGVHRLVEAAPRILSECPLARIIIAGRGPEAENLKRQAEALGVTERVNFIGFISDENRNRLFKTADCAIFPSLYEPFGIVALEAMALGCPVVVSDVGGFSEVVTHTETGITTYPDNAESVAWGVLRALTHPELARKYADKAQQQVRDIFNWRRIALLTLEVYRSAL